MSNAWSHPHSSNLHKHGWMEDGGYLGGPYALLFDGINDHVNCGSGATLDNLPSGEFTVEAWIFVGTANGSYAVIGKHDDLNDIGWDLFLTAGKVYFRVKDNTGAATQASIDEIVGSWVHIAGYYNDAGDRKVRVSAKGAWSVSSSALANPISNDAAVDLEIGVKSNPTVSWMSGRIGWIRITNADTYGAVAGTDFVPPRTFPGGGVESWAMDDGSGATVTASVTSPGNDGTITGATWERQWDQFGSPVVPYSVLYNASDTETVIADAATIQDLADNAFTLEGWFLADTAMAAVTTQGALFEKGGTSGGYFLNLYNVTGMLARIICTTTNAQTLIPTLSFSYDTWHHIAMTFDDAGDRKIYIYIDGVFVSQSQTAGVGAIQTDVGNTLDIGYRNTRAWGGNIGWIKVSNSVRYTAEFTPPSRLNPPAPDANTMVQLNHRDGAGTTLIDSSGNANHGTISNGKWNITPDMEIDAPGSRIYNWGYTLGADAIDEGIVEYYTGITAGSNRVHRPVIRYEADHRAQPYVEAYDDTNGASISKFLLPWLNGTHDGGNNSATLSDSTAPNWPVSLVGATVYNITDGSKATITSIAGNTVIAGALAGGTDNDWDNGDEYRIFPKTTWAFAETWTFELPTIARNGVAADCTAYSIRVANSNDEGTFYVLQMEQLANLIDNPSAETGAGNPWIPDGWTNGTIAVGETLQESTIVHSGGSSIEFIAACSGKYLYPNDQTIVADKFYSAGAWFYSDGSSEVTLRSTNSSQLHVHYNSTVAVLDFSSNAYWAVKAGVFRCPTGTTIPRPGFRAGSGATGLRYLDDFYFFELDDVSLTVTPASQANSVESGGPRIDGRDQCTQPIPAGLLGPTSGRVDFGIRFRHDDGDFEKFGVSDPRICSIYNNANNYIECILVSNTQIRLSLMLGGLPFTTDVDFTGLIAVDTTYVFSIRYDGAGVYLYQDDVLRITVAQPIDWVAQIPNVFYAGANQANTLHSDIVMLAP